MLRQRHIPLPEHSILSMAIDSLSVAAILAILYRY